MQIGMLDHLQKWFVHFMKMHSWLHKYSAICLSVPAYHAFTPKKKSYQEVSQWNGEEMKGMSRYMLAVVTESLRGGNHTQRPIFNRAIDCTRELLEFDMYGRYESHDDPSLCYMEDALHRFDTYKDSFLLGRAGKNAKAKPNALRTELVRKRKFDQETIPETGIGSKKRREMNAWRDYISHMINTSK